MSEEQRVLAENLLKRGYSAASVSHILQIEKDGIKQFDEFKYNTTFDSNRIAILPSA